MTVFFENDAVTLIISDIESPQPTPSSTKFFSGTFFLGVGIIVALLVCFVVVMLVRRQRIKQKMESSFDVE